MKANKETRKTPEQWEKALGIVILDPDGWDRMGDFHADWRKPLTEAEFRAKADASTTCPA